MKDLDNTTENREFASTTEMISAVAEEDLVEAACPGVVEIHEWHWIAIVVIVLALVLAVAGIDLGLIFAMIFIPFAIYAVIKGFRSRPDCFAVTPSQFVVLEGVTFNRNTDRFSFNRALVAERSDVKKLFTFGFGALKVRLGPKAKASLQQSLFTRVQKHYPEGMRIGAFRRKVF